MNKTNKTGLLTMVVILLLIIVGVGFFIFNQTKQSKATSFSGSALNEISQKPAINTNLQGNQVVVGKESGQVKEITIEASMYKYLPSSFSVKAGERVRIILKNTEGMQ